MKNKDKPKVVKGSHLTVTTYPNGKVDLKWDWEALVEDVRRATNPEIEHDLSYLQSLNKLQLEHLGREHGIELDRRKKKDKLIAELVAVTK